MIRYMLSILMDGIKDTEMYIGYAEEAADNNSEYGSWFKNHAKMRYDALKTDYDFICKEINLQEKARSGDAIAEALMCHLQYQMKELNERYNAI